GTLGKMARGGQFLTPLPYRRRCISLKRVLSLRRKLVLPLHSRGRITDRNNNKEHPSRSRYASKVQIPDLYSILRLRLFRISLGAALDVSAKQKRRAVRAAAAGRLQTPDRTDLRPKLLSVPRRRKNDGATAAGQP